MPPDTPAFGGGATATILHPAVAIAILFAIALMYLLPLRYVVVPFLAGVFLSPVGQQVVVGGVHFYMLRILILFGWGRLLLLKTTSPQALRKMSWTPVDSAFLAWAICRASAFVLVNGGNSGALVNQAGLLLDALGGYYLLRHLIANDQDIVRVIRSLGVLAAVLGLCMAYEHLRGFNVFGLFGGVSTTPELRNGSFRAQASFAHSLLAGSFGATLLPLAIWLWKSGKGKASAVIALLGAGAMTASTATSTPLLACAAGIVALACWPLRHRMQTVRRGLAFSVVALHLVMKAPVWFVIQHIDLTGSSSSYDRAMLVDNCIRHFSDWWLIGTPNTASYGISMWDLCNQYVAEAETGGLLTLVFFLAIVCRCFGRLGRARKADHCDRRREWFLWCLGAALFAHVVGFFGISYFDQTRVAWYALLAIIVAATVAPPMDHPSQVDDADLAATDALDVAGVMA